MVIAKSLRSIKESHILRHRSRVRDQALSFVASLPMFHIIVEDRKHGLCIDNQVWLQNDGVEFYSDLFRHEINSPSSEEWRESLTFV